MITGEQLRSHARYGTPLRKETLEELADRLEALKLTPDTRRLALEEAAKVCEEMFESVIDRGEHNTDDYLYSGDVAKAIRTLAAQPERSQP